MYIRRILQGGAGVYVDTPLCKMHTVYVWRIVQEGRIWYEVGGI